MSDPGSFPPSTIEAFLRFCAGEWMSLRSRFDLSLSPDEGDGDTWHQSDRGDLVVTYLEGTPGGLRVGPKDQPARQLHFASDGSFSSSEEQGVWTLWPDGSLELVMDQGNGELRERIWFTKPNLRLRSTVLQHKDGTPAQASFSSEIRRVSRPA